MRSRLPGVGGPGAALRVRAIVLCALVMLATDGWAGKERVSKVKRVSLIQLIARPSDYHGRLVEVPGFCRLEFEGNALYVHKEDFERVIFKNALWLDVGWPVPEQWRAMSDEYVVVQAVFDAELRLHAEFSGVLRDVRSIQRRQPRSERERGHRLVTPPRR